MKQEQIKKLYLVAIQELIDANQRNAFCATKDQAMKDINFWRNQLKQSNNNNNQINQKVQS